MSHLLSVFDLDHTLLSVNSSYFFGRHLYSRGILSFVDMLYMATCYWRHKCLGMSIENVHHKIFRRFFSGRSFPEIEHEVNQFLDQYLPTMIYAPILKRLRSAQEKREHVLILSSSPHFLVKGVASRLNVKEWEGSYYALDQYNCLSHIARLIDGKTKASFVNWYSERLGLSREKIVVYTDSYLDLPMIEVVGRCVGVNPDRRLRRLCNKKGWEIL